MILRDWKRIQEYDKDKGFLPKELKTDYEKCYAGVVDEVEGKVLIQRKCYHCNPWKVEPKQRKRMKKLQENRKDLHWKEKRELEALERRYSKEEQKIQQLRDRISELEDITNRTPEQEQELKDKKKELEKSEKETKSTSSNFWEKYKGWVIEGGVILILLIILWIVWPSRNYKK